MDRNADNRELAAALNAVLLPSHKTLVWHESNWRLVELDRARPLASLARYARRLRHEGGDMPDLLEPLVAAVEQREAREVEERKAAEAERERARHAPKPERAI